MVQMQILSAEPRILAPGHGILTPCIAWFCLGVLLLVASYAIQACRPLCSASPRPTRLVPVWLCDCWSTILVFLIVVPNLQILVMLAVGGLLSVLEGWSFSAGFHYHTFMLGLTHMNLGAAEPPAETLGLLSNMYATLTGSISSYVALYIAAMTAVTRNVAELAPDGFRGLVVAIFLFYPPLVACLAHIIGAVMCAIEAWEYFDSFLLACSWLSGVPLKIDGCKISSEASMFIVTVCHMIALAMKITVLDFIYYNTFPRKAVHWIDTWVAQEGDVAAAEFEVVGRRDLCELEEECAAMQLENEQMREGNERLRRRLERARRAAAKRSGVASIGGSPKGKWGLAGCLAARNGPSSDRLAVGEAGPLTTIYGSANVGLPARYPYMRQCYPQETAGARDCAGDSEPSGAS